LSIIVDFIDMIDQLPTLIF